MCGGIIPSLKKTCERTRDEVVDVALVARDEHHRAEARCRPHAGQTVLIDDDPVVDVVPDAVDDHVEDADPAKAHVGSEVTDDLLGLLLLVDASLPGLLGLRAGARHERALHRGIVQHELPGS
jgi:hypothetical protein